MFDPAHLVFLDETAANTKMMRLGGSLPGAATETLIGQVPRRPLENDTLLVGALTLQGNDSAICVIDGAMKGKTFLVSMVEQPPRFQLCRRNDTVVMGHTFRHTRQQRRARSD